MRLFSDRRSVVLGVDGYTYSSVDRILGEKTNPANSFDSGAPRKLDVSETRVFLRADRRMKTGIRFQFILFTRGTSVCRILRIRIIAASFGRVVRTTIDYPPVPTLFSLREALSRDLLGAFYSDRDQSYRRHSFERLILIGLVENAFSAFQQRFAPHLISGSSSHRCTYSSWRLQSAAIILTFFERASKYYRFLKLTYVHIGSSSRVAVCSNLMILFLKNNRFCLWPMRVDK